MLTMPALAGTPSDDVPEILATGRTDVTAIFVSMSSRHPEGRDADYLAWHSLDHRPEQYRLAGLAASPRGAFTPPWRAARAGGPARVAARAPALCLLFAAAAGPPAFRPARAA